MLCVYIKRFVHKDQVASSCTHAKYTKSFNQVKDCWLLYILDFQKKHFSMLNNTSRNTKPLVKPVWYGAKHRQLLTKGNDKNEKGNTLMNGQVCMSKHGNKNKWISKRHVLKPLSHLDGMVYLGVRKLETMCWDEIILSYINKSHWIHTEHNIQNKYALM